MRGRSNRIVPLAMKWMTLEPDGGHLRVGDAHAARIAVPIDLGSDAQTGAAVRRADQTDDRGVKLFTRKRRLQQEHIGTRVMGLSQSSRSAITMIEVAASTRVRSSRITDGPIVGPTTLTTTSGPMRSICNHLDTMNRSQDAVPCGWGVRTVGSISRERL